ncbi:transposable element Tcb2 transposase [Trichonephila clavipes]|uniref:Transposable element Tcb2 transposase n=1 Tax=Trichonephila clavipes TaxID=2585209 RepID=A0A8X6VZM3_TRICX|nr:transposable element Tcb2 transposase [Trichonephila clavipes]
MPMYHKSVTVKTPHVDVVWTIEEFFLVFWRIVLDRWVTVLFTDESRFGLNTDSRRTFTWREPRTHNLPSNVCEINSYGGGGLVRHHVGWPLHVFERGSVTGVSYRDEVLVPYVHLLSGTCGHEFILIDDQTRPHRALLVDEFLESEDIRRMGWLARSPDLNP